MRLKGWLGALVAAGFCLGSGGATYLAGGKAPMDGLLLDVTVAARAALAGRGAPDEEPRVAVVALDAASLDAAELAPYPRAFFGPFWARLIDGLFGAGAEAVAFDLLLPYSANQFTPGFDRPFLAALARNRGRIILGRSAGTLPAPPYLGALRFDPGALGLIELAPDRDEVYRTVPSGFRTTQGDDRVPGLVAAALARAGAPGMPDRVLVVPWRHLESIPAYSLIDVLRCASEAPETLGDAFRGKVVFVGTTLPEEDRKLSAGRFLPPPRGGTGATSDGCGLRRLGASKPSSPTVPGVFLHAAAADAVLRGGLTETATPLVGAVLAGASALVGAAAGLFLMPWFAVGAILVGVLTLWGVEVVLLARDEWLAVGPSLAAMVASVVLAYVVRYLVEERRRRRMQRAFGRYLAPALVERLTERGEEPELGGAQQPITVMFADLSGFTALSERISAPALVVRTNEYLALIASEVDVTGGYVDKFIGDAVMGLWGAPVSDEDHGLRGVRTALAVAARVRLARERGSARGETGFGVKIGINSGDAVVGNVGSEKRFNYTAVGETVNIASRLEALSPTYRCEIVIGPVTAEAVGNEFLVRELDRVAVKGKQQAIRIFEPLAKLAEAAPEQRSLGRRYEEALSHYRARRFAEALAIWEALAAEDGPSAAMAERARAYLDTPPSGDWDGVWVMTAK